jgi:hypothetical protein
MSTTRGRRQGESKGERAILRLDGVLNMYALTPRFLHIATEWAALWRKLQAKLFCCICVGGGRWSRRCC